MVAGLEHTIVHGMYMGNRVTEKITNFHITRNIILTRGLDRKLIRAKMW